MIETHNSKISISRQSELVHISRSSIYYRPAKASNEDLLIMRKIDEIYLNYPFYGSRRMAWQLQQEGFLVGRDKARSLMKLMGIEALYPKARTTMANKEHKKYPYLLRDLKITETDHVWAADITYIPMHKGFMYLIAIIDWFSRFIVGYELSNTLEAFFCVDLLSRCLGKRKPQIFNTDQGSQFTGESWISCLKENDISISMDGKGRAIDNVVIERFWRSIKYELIYLNPAESVKELNSMIGRYIEFYNYIRPHQGLANIVPARLFFGKNGGYKCSSKIIKLY